jgi:hypothetical protein
MFNSAFDACGGLSRIKAKPDSAELGLVKVAFAADLGSELASRRNSGIGQSHCRLCNLTATIN